MGILKRVKVNKQELYQQILDVCLSNDGLCMDNDEEPRILACRIVRELVDDDSFEPEDETEEIDE